ncbi:unnamed protein product, partial [Trichobilharzia szidati]
QRDKKQLPTVLWITAFVCGCIGFVLHIFLAFIRRFRTLFPLNVITVSFAIILWCVVVAVYCRELCWVYILIALGSTAVIGLSASLIGFKSKPLSAVGYCFFIVISMIFIIIGIMFLFHHQLFGFPFLILYGVFIGIGIAV